MNSTLHDSGTRSAISTNPRFRIFFISLGYVGRLGKLVLSASCDMTGGRGGIVEPLVMSSLPSAGFDIENGGNPARASGLGIHPMIASSAGWECFINERTLNKVQVRAWLPGCASSSSFFKFYLFIYLFIDFLLDPYLRTWLLYNPLVIDE